MEIPQNNFEIGKRNKSTEIINIEEEKTLINPNLLYKIISIIILIVMILLAYFYFNISIINNDNFENMLPRITPEENSKPPSSLDEIFNSRQIYITDAKITPGYIKYIRPINETEEEKYNKRYSEGNTIIDTKMFERRSDQLDYIKFCDLALKEKLIYKIPTEYDNKPDISIIITSYNRKNILLKSIRSIQNQKFNNIEIIIVNDCSTDKSESLFNDLLKSDPRIRIFHHKKNMGCWRSRLDGILYSKGKYVILFDAGDFYEDNYVLEDAYNIIEKYNLDSVKFLFRIIRDYKRIEKSKIPFHVGKKAKIVYGPDNIFNHNRKVFSTWGNVWNRLVRANIYSKALFQLNELILNLHKNVWDDVWYNKIVHKVSFSYAIFERSGYVFLQNGWGEGSPRSGTKNEKSKIIKEYIGFLYYTYNFSPKYGNKSDIIDKLKVYDKTHKRLQIKNMRGHFEVLNNLLEALIKDPGVTKDDKKYLKQLLYESKEREKNIQKK